MNKQQSDREEFENGVGDEMFSHFYEPYQQNHKDEVWAWINAQIESKLKQAKQEGAKEVLEEVIPNKKRMDVGDIGASSISLPKVEIWHQETRIGFNRCVDLIKEKLSNLNNKSNE